MADVTREQHESWCQVFYMSPDATLNNGEFGGYACNCGKALRDAQATITTQAATIERLEAALNGLALSDEWIALYAVVGAMRDGDVIGAAAIKPMVLDLDAALSRILDAAHPTDVSVPAAPQHAPASGEDGPSPEGSDTTRTGAGACL